MGFKNKIKREPVPEGEGAPPAEGEDAPPPAPPLVDDDENLVPDPTDPFAFVPKGIMPTELEAALTTQSGGALSSALHVAPAGGYWEVVEVLLKVGANPRELDLQKNMPGQVAQANGHFKIAELLSQLVGSKARAVTLGCRVAEKDGLICQNIIYEEEESR